MVVGCKFYFRNRVLLSVLMLDLKRASVGLDGLFFQETKVQI
jgi:hypothetical protein